MLYGFGLGPSWYSAVTAVDGTGYQIFLVLRQVAILRPFDQVMFDDGLWRWPLGHDSSSGGAGGMDSKSEASYSGLA